MGIVKLSTAGILDYQKYSSLLAGNDPYIPFISDYELLETEILTGSQTSVEFTSLDSYTDYQHFQIRGTLRSNRGDTMDQVGIQMNSDTGSNYSWHYMEARTSTTSVGYDAGATQSNIFAGWMTGNTGTADVYNAFVTDILDPLDTSKNTTIRHFYGIYAAFTIAALHSGARYNTEALTSIKYYSRLGASLVSGSRLSLYGLRSA